MTEEVFQPPAGEQQPAPEQETTAVPDTEVDKPETAESTDPKPTRVFTQEELDAEIGKRLARAQRKWERELAAKERPAQPVSPAKDVPPADQFESPEAYAEALAAKKAEELVQRRDQERQQAEIRDAYHEREEAAREKYDDFEQVAYNRNLRITQVMAETIQASEIGPEVAYHLGLNPKEADRISRLPPLLQAREIGKIEVKLAEGPPAKKATSAPAPIKPVASRQSSAPSFDTTDPRSVGSMSTSEWIEAERQRQVRKMQAQLNNR